MRRVAMRLHSPEQLGKMKKKEQQQAAEAEAEAEADAAATKSNGTQTKAAEEEKQEQQQQRRFAPTLQGYTRFLRESKLVYDFLEQTVRDKERYAAFRESGLERGGRLALDIASLEKRLRAQTDEGGGEEMKKDEEEGLHAGAEYVKYLESLERESEAKFLCHYYNVYFAHTAGGRMIGNAVSKALLEGDTLQFYCYGDAEGEEASSKETIQPMLDVVREEINAIAEGWSEKEKEECLQETELSFKYSGQLLRLISTS